MASAFFARPKAWTVLFMVLSFVLCGNLAFAEIRIVEAESVYRVGDNDSRIDARRIAVQEAKRKALDLAGTYVESLSEVKNHQLNRDEIRIFTAGILETEIIADELRGTVEHPEIHIRARCSIDTEVLFSEIEHYRHHEDLKAQLEASSRENENLRKEREALVSQLSTLQNGKKSEDTRKKISAVLAREEANQETGRVWRSLATKLSADGQQVSADEAESSIRFLEQALSAGPQNLRARYLLAALYQKRGNVSSTERVLRGGVRSNPSNPLPHMQLGVFLKARGQHKEALKEFHFVERLRPHDPMMLFYTGMTLKDLRRCGPSVRYLERFLKSPGANRLHGNREQAVQAIKECGGTRGGYQKRVRYP